METSELAIHLRELLISWGYDIKKAAKYTSHSLKATFLSWTAKAGIDRELQRILGYHAKLGDKTIVVYQRDAMAEPLRQLAVVLRLVRDKEFDPDSSRSGRWLNIVGEEGGMHLLQQRVAELATEEPRSEHLLRTAAPEADGEQPEVPPDEMNPLPKSPELPPISGLAHLAPQSGCPTRMNRKNEPDHLMRSSSNRT